MPTTSTVPASLETALAAINVTRMLDQTARLCAPSFAGRRVGTDGHARAAAFLLEQLRQPGWDVRSEGFTLTAPVLQQWSPLILTQMGNGETTVRVLVHRTEFCEHPRSAAHPEVIEGSVKPITQAGSLQGAWIALEAVPQGTAFTDLATQLAKQGAVGLLAPLYATAEGYLVKRIMAAPPLALPVLSVRADLLATLVGTRIRASVPVTAHRPQGTNLLAQLDGTDAHLVSTPLLIGAHYDAVGDDVGGLRLPGATDNAAAVAVLLELASILTHWPPPRRPLLLAAFDAEEVGAQGSRELVQHLKAAGKRPLVLNLDGAARCHEAVWVEPGPQTEAILQALDQAGRWLAIPLTSGNIASDHRSFTTAGFPAVGLSVGAAGLHTPVDSIEQVQPAALRVAAALLLATIWQLAWAN